MNAQVMEVVRAHSKAVFSVRDAGGRTHRALTLVTRDRCDMETLDESTQHAPSHMFVAETYMKGDQVLVLEVPQFIFRLDMEAEDFISHILLGLMAPSFVRPIASELVE